MEKPFPAYRGSNPYIFVSYSHADEDEVYAQIRWLQDQGINVWYDTTGIGVGSEWNDEIAKAIKDADRFLFFITPNSVASEHCRRELNFAQSEDRRIIAVHLTATELPDGVHRRVSCACPSSVFLRGAGFLDWWYDDAGPSHRDSLVNRGVIVRSVPGEALNIDLNLVEEIVDSAAIVGSTVRHCFGNNDAARRILRPRNIQFDRIDMDAI